MSHCIRVDEEVFAIALAAKHELEAERGESVSMSDGIRRAINNAGIAQIPERDRIPRRLWPYREPRPQKGQR